MFCFFFAFQNKIFPFLCFFIFYFYSLVINFIFKAFFLFFCFEQLLHKVIFINNTSVFRVFFMLAASFFCSKPPHCTLINESSILFLSFCSHFADLLFFSHKVFAMIFHQLFVLSLSFTNIFWNNA